MSTADVERERLRVVTGLLKTAKGRETLAHAGHTPGGFVLAAHAEEHVGDVMRRVAESPSREVVLVVYEKKRSAYLRLQPGHLETAAEAQEVGPEATLGMLVDVMSQAPPGSPWNLSITAWKSAIATAPLVLANKSGRHAPAPTPR
jgi:hypothetical protein